MTDLALGKLPPKGDVRNFRFSSLLTPLLPEPPEAFDMSRTVRTYPMYDNDRMGNCTCVTAAHMVQLWTKMAGKYKRPALSSVHTMYKRVNGGEDRGAYVTDVLNVWRKKGVGRNKIMAYAEMDPNRASHVKSAMCLFGGVYVGLDLPLSARGQVGSVWTPTARSDSLPGSWGGHAVNMVEYDAAGLTCVTWGKLQKMTWGFWETYCDEAYAVLTEDWRDSSVTAVGFDLVTLRSMLEAL